jgi:hypothetical protein
VKSASRELVLPKSKRIHFMISPHCKLDQEKRRRYHHSAHRLSCLGLSLDLMRQSNLNFKPKESAHCSVDWPPRLMRAERSYQLKFINSSQSFKWLTVHGNRNIRIVCLRLSSSPSNPIIPAARPRILHHNCNLI